MGKFNTYKVITHVVFFITLVFQTLCIKHDMIRYIFGNKFILKQA